MTLLIGREETLEMINFENRDAGCGVREGGGLQAQVFDIAFGSHSELLLQGNYRRKTLNREWSGLSGISGLSERWRPSGASF